MARSKGQTRQERIRDTESSGRKVNEKFSHEHKNAPIVAMTEKQKKYLALLNDPNIQLLVVLGLHGVGKSFLSATVAADKYMKKEIDKIIVARPYVQTGKSNRII